MLNTLIKPKTTQLIIAIIIAILTTGFLRLQLFSGLPSTDDGYYVFASQFYYNNLTNSLDIKDMPLHLFPLVTSWVYSLDVNQYVSLRLIDGLVAIFTSIILFKVILKESNSTLFTVILMSTLLILMNGLENIGYGFRNSIWAAYLPLFSALLVWQNASTEDKYSFYLIGGLVSLGILLREPFLPFFLLAGIAILIGYGWRVLVKYLIGSALLGFSVLGFMLMLRGWDLLGLIESYLYIGGGLSNYKNLSSDFFNFFGLSSVKSNWFIYITASVSIIYLIKLNSTNKKSVSTNRFYFWLGVVLLPILEPMMKIGMEYHFANCLPGLAGLSAMGWKYMSNQESERTKAISITVIGLISLFMILPTIDRTLIKSSYIYGPVDAIKWAKASDSFRGAQMIERSQYLKVAAKVYGLSREDSTLAVSGFWQPIYPLTGLLPPIFKLSQLRSLYLEYNYDDDKIIEVIKKYQPTIIVSSKNAWRGEDDIPGIIEKTNLYEKVDSVDSVPRKIGDTGLDINSSLSAIIYRLKDFK